MNHTKAALLLGAALLAVPAAVAQDTIDLVAGQSVCITLPGNPTTGFVWQVAACPSVVKVELALESNKTAPQARPVCGRPCRTVVTITGVKAGQGTVRLIYARPWAKEAPPAKTKLLDITVK